MSISPVKATWKCDVCGVVVEHSSSKKNPDGWVSWVLHKKLGGVPSWDQKATMHTCFDCSQKLGAKGVFKQIFKRGKNGKTRSGGEGGNSSED